MKCCVCGAKATTSQIVVNDPQRLRRWFCSNVACEDAEYDRIQGYVPGVAQEEDDWEPPKKVVEVPVQGELL